MICGDVHHTAAAAAGAAAGATAAAGLAVGAAAGAAGVGGGARLGMHRPMMCFTHSAELLPE